MKPFLQWLSTQLQIKILTSVQGRHSEKSVSLSAAHTDSSGALQGAIVMSMYLNAFLAPAWVSAQGSGIQMCQRNKIISNYFITALKIIDLLSNFNEYVYYWHLNSHVDWVSSWEWLQVTGGTCQQAEWVRMGQTPWVLPSVVGFIVPALNWDVLCTCRTRKARKILPMSLEACRALVHWHQSVSYRATCTE